MRTHYNTNLKSLLPSYTYMKLVNFVPVLVLLIAATAVMAAHVPQASIQPSEWPVNAVKDVTLNIVNSAGSNIVMVELSVPERDQNPLYTMQEISTPAGWTYQTTVRIGQSQPYKVTWYTNGAGIAADESLNFGLKVLSTKDVGEYVWTWTTTDNQGGAQTGVLKTRTTMAPVSSLRITAPSKVKAGNSFSVSVTAYDSTNKIKTDYTGTVRLESSDSLAIMPSQYTFSASDRGQKSFTVKLKTAGNQAVSVMDAMNGVSAASNIEVEAGQAVSLQISTSNVNVNAGQTVVFSSTAEDLYGNRFTVTNKTLWDIDNEAGGNWIGNTYGAGNTGLWTVTGRYGSLLDGVTLSVGGATIPQVPEEVPPAEEEVPEEVPETQMAEMTLTGESSVVIPAGANDTMVLSVNNDGNVDLTGVKLSFSGIPSDWVMTFPLSSDISAGSSKDYLVIIYVPENETGSKQVTFMSSSNQGATAEKNVTLSLEAGPTGLAGAIPRNVLQIGVVIIAVAAVIIIGYELWFKK
jgi:hypothetical protein